MPAIQLATGYWDDAVNKTDRIRLHNMLLAENKANPVDQLMRRQRPGLVDNATIGTAVQAIWQQDGTLGGARLVVSNGELYAGPTGLGAVGSSGIQMAGSGDRVVTVASGSAYRSDGATLTPIAMPDGLPVQSVRYINGFFLLSVKDSQRFYWIQPGADDPDPLDFAEAERTPDNIISIALSGSEIWFLGAAGEEVWTPTADPDAPFQRINGRVYAFGCADIDSVAEQDNRIFWVSSSHSVVAALGTPSEISDDAIDGILESDTTFRGWTYKLGGHAMYVLTSDSITLAFDMETGQPSRFSSFNRETWRAWTGCQIGPAVYAGDQESGAIWKLDFREHTDAGQPLIRELSATVANTGPPVPCASVSLGMSVGWAPEYGYEPSLEMRWSDDQGRTWVPWRRFPLGEKGQYSTDAVERSLGLITRPGRTFVWRISDNVLWRADYARINDA